MKRVLQAYPLWIVDPLFSVWSCTDILNESDAAHWTGLSRRAFGYVRYNGKTYGFLGRRSDVIPLEQTDVRVRAFSTDYTFRAEEFTLKVSFLSPLPPDDLDLLSCPVCYTVREKYEPRLWRNLFGIFLLIFLAIPRYYCVIFTKI